MNKALLHIAALSILFLGLNCASAQEIAITQEFQNQGLAEYSWELSPGQKYREVVNIENLTSKTLTFNFKITETRSELTLKDPDENQENFGQWVTLEHAELTLPPKETMQNTIQISIPQDASPGDYVGAILVSKPHAQPDKGVAVKLQLAIYSLIKVTDNPRPIEKVYPTISPPLLYFSLSLFIFYTVLCQILFRNLRERYKIE